MNTKKSLGLLLLGGFLVLWSLPGLALASHKTTVPSATNAPVLSVALGSSEDNTLYETLTGTLSNGAGAYFFAGRTAESSGSIRRGLVRFDIASSIPPTATIVGVTLYLTASQTTAGPQPIQLHRVTASWGEGTSNATTRGGGSGAPSTTDDATWIHRFYSSTLWTTPGGDFVAAASATTAVNNPGGYSWSTPGMVSDVQQWLNAPTTNDGWLLSGNETTSSTAKRFDTRENPDPNARPLLVVTYMLLPYKVRLPIALKS